MRCPSCGTENEPDSRFCGGCGARLGGVERRVAPTQRISDAGQQQLHVSAQQAAPQHVSRPPTSQPPTSRPPESLPPALATSQQPRAAARSAPPAPAPAASASIAPAQGRRWGLILVVLLVDLGLAAAGAWLLGESLHADGGGPAKPVESTSSTRLDLAPAPAAAAVSAVAVEAAAPAPTPVVTPLPAAAPVDAGTPVADHAPAPTQAKKATSKVKKPARPSKASSSATQTPVNPYDDVPIGAPGPPPGSP
jgi:hypothetical protein